MELYKRSFISIIAVIILFDQQVYSTTTDSPQPTVSIVEFSKLSIPNNRKISVKSSSNNDECVDNNSIENKCSNSKDKVEQGQVLLDDKVKLKTRLRDYDRLDDNKLFAYEYDPIDYESQKTLRQVLLLHRHGDRTPIQFAPKDPLKDEPFWEFHGYGQLTNRGKARVYLLGKLIRERYDKFLNNSVNKNQRLSKSSGSLRCIESAEMFLAGFLGLNLAVSSDAQQLIWDKNNNPLAHLWQPASIQSVPAKFDGMLAEGADCKATNEIYENIEQSELVKQIYKEYKNEADVMKQVLGFEIDHFYKWFWGSSQIEVERAYFENKMDQRILSIYDRMQEAGNLALKAFQSTKQMRRIRAGMLVNDMIYNMKHLRDLNHNIGLDKSGDTTIDKKKFIHYSAHDLTIIVLLGILDSWDKFPVRPEYAANLIMELHQSSEDEWFVKIFYMFEVPSKHVELHLNSCENGHPKNRCTLDKLAELMKPYMIESWQVWMKECQNDVNLIDPYLTGH